MVAREDAGGACGSHVVRVGECAPVRIGRLQATPCARYGPIVLSAPAATSPFPCGRFCQGAQHHGDRRHARLRAAPVLRSLLWLSVPLPLSPLCVALSLSSKTLNLNPLSSPAVHSCGGRRILEDNPLFRRWRLWNTFRIHTVFLCHRASHVCPWVSQLECDRDKKLNPRSRKIICHVPARAGAPGSRLSPRGCKPHSLEYAAG